MSWAQGLILRGDRSRFRHRCVWPIFSSLYMEMLTRGTFLSLLSASRQDSKPPSSPTEIDFKRDFLTIEPQALSSFSAFLHSNRNPLFYLHIPKIPNHPLGCSTSGRLCIRIIWEQEVSQNIIQLPMEKSILSISSSGICLPQMGIPHSRCKSIFPK